jgi:phospholipid/cholesterol/gamma-HCH transport system substrate-binding protein
MENRAHAIAAAVFVVVLLGLLLATVFWLSGGTIRGIPYDLVTESSVAGLSAGSPVRLRGVEVGQIESIGFDPHDPHRVRVRAVLDRTVHLMQGTRGTISSLGLSSAAYVELDYPDHASGVLQSSVESPARIPVSPSQFAELTAAGTELARTFTDTLHRLNSALTPENARNLSELLTNLNEAALNANALTRELRPAAQHADTVVMNVNDLARTLRSTVADLDALIAGAGAPGSTLDAIRSGALDTGAAARGVERALVDDTLPRVDTLTERLSQTADSLTRLLDQARGEPQSFLFGLPSATPGPGEPGFREPTKRAATAAIAREAR